MNGKKQIVFIIYFVHHHRIWTCMINMTGVRPVLLALSHVQNLPDIYEISIKGLF